MKFDVLNNRSIPKVSSDTLAAECALNICTIYGATISGCTTATKRAISSISDLCFLVVFMNMHNYQL